MSTLDDSMLLRILYLSTTHAWMSKSKHHSSVPYRLLEYNPIVLMLTMVIECNDLISTTHTPAMRVEIAMLVGAL